MRKCLSLSVSGVGLFGVAWSVIGQPLVSVTSPTLPTTDDTVWVLITGSIASGDTIIDSAISVSQYTIHAFISILPCRGACPRSLKTVNLRLVAGRLVAGTYNLVTTINQINRSQSPPDTSYTVTSRSFTVYPARVSPHRLVGVYQSSHSVIDYDTGSYYFANGDTLSVTAVFSDQCCARYSASIHSTGDGDGDTITILVCDTARLLCDCVSTQYVTVAMADVSAKRLWIRLLYSNAWSNAPQLLYSFVADYGAPGLCLNLSNTDQPGFTLFVDSSWFSYELPSPVVKRISVLRLQPNPRYQAFTSQSLFVDNIAFDTMTAAGIWAENITTLEDFEAYYHGQWQIIAYRDGSALAQYWLLSKSGYLTELEYSNTVSGSVSNYLWRSRNPSIALQRTSRIFLTASCAKPEGATAAGPKLVSRSNQRGDQQLLIRADDAHQIIRLHFCKTFSAPLYIETVGIDGRLYNKTMVSDNNRMIELSSLRRGWCLVRLRNNRNSIVEEKQIVVP